jgi:hypothetical protein
MNDAWQIIARVCSGDTTGITLRKPGRMTRAQLREELMEPTCNMYRDTLMPFLAECCLAAAKAPTYEAFVDAQDLIRASKSPLKHDVHSGGMRIAWVMAGGEEIVKRWQELRV